jgi:hypothetical protein
MTTDLNQQAQGSNGDFFENDFDTEVAELASQLTTVLYRLRVLQHRLDLTPEDTLEKKILQDVVTKVRAALGRPEYFGLLDLLGIQMKEGWPEGAIVAGHYVVSSPRGEERSYAVYRFDTDTGVLYSMPELNHRGFSLWHTSHEGVVMHLSASIGTPPGGRYIIEPDRALGREH